MRIVKQCQFSDRWKIIFLSLIFYPKNFHSVFSPKEIIVIFVCFVLWSAKGGKCFLVKFLFYRVVDALVNFKPISVSFLTFTEILKTSFKNICVSPTDYL